MHACKGTTAELGATIQSGVFGVNSNRKKTGPKPSSLGMLLVWESEWYGVFYGLALGADEIEACHEHFEPTRPPKITGIEELDKERMHSFNLREKQPGAWQREKYSMRRPKLPAESEVWQKLNDAKSVIEGSSSVRLFFVLAQRSAESEALR